ncbi:hypothetical protein PM082_004248 [Marasmius tenuissimus]|nr:hypothetical protein PM082_004248 [Marasmius tenuissimus]
MASNDTNSAAAALLTFDMVFIWPMSSLLVVFATYGLYMVVFGLSIRVLTRQRNTWPVHKLYIWCTTLLFALDNLYVAGYTMQAFRQVMFQYEAARSGDLDYLMEDFYTDRVNDVGL